MAGGGGGGGTVRVSDRVVIDSGGWGAAVVVHVSLGFLGFFS